MDEDSDSAAADSESTGSETAGSESTGSEVTDSEVIEMRTVETALGAVDIPVNPQRVLALDEYAAMNLLAVGITPLEVIGAYGSHVSQQILVESGVGISDTADASVINFELVAALEPDVIVMTAESAFLGYYDQLSEIAPTITLLYAAPWREAIETTGATFGREEEVVEIVAALEGRLAEVSEVVAASEARSISILGETYGITFGVSHLAPLAEVVLDAGLVQPEAQSEAEVMPGFDSVVPVSTELLEGHDADLVVVLSGDFYNEQTLLEAATFKVLPAVKDGRSFVVDGDMWFGTHPFAIFWIIEDIAALAAGEGQSGVGELEDTTDRWTAYQALLGS